MAAQRKVVEIAIGEADAATLQSIAPLAYGANEPSGRVRILLHDRPSSWSGPPDRPALPGSRKPVRGHGGAQRQSAAWQGA